MVWRTINEMLGTEKHQIDLTHLKKDLIVDSPDWRGEGMGKCWSKG
jgi:hypothetical protein